MKLNVVSFSTLKLANIFSFDIMIKKIKNYRYLLHWVVNRDYIANLGLFFHFRKDLNRGLSMGIRTYLYTTY